ncbi:DMT family transporter [Sinorhizobium medicae]|nr:DMT family transporter [Sinorhizobium medicae]MBO1942525.1 DMT family transporter [Sinorhizobium medicae]MDX0956177.1 DMT family transporter [Sinorhizobium medicae]TWA26837.1 EamA-like transporter family protein [Sinorhizobium medicae]TWA28490.1 EamA-like transporter family protein [Sinorhizobium medicae]TWA30459.1 EamA-like transporter family protein [Sinorhizobium medicae]
MKKIAMPAVVAGALLMGANSLVAAMDSVIVRFVAGEVHPIGIVFFRNLASLGALYLLIRSRGFVVERTMSFHVHAIRAIIKLLALLAAFIAVTQIPLASATAIAFTMPLFVAFGSVLFLGERFSSGRALSLAGGFAGILIVVRPGAETFDTGAAWALASAVGLAIVALLMKVSAGREDPVSIAWLNLLVTVPVAFLLALPFWQTPSLFSLFLMTLQGIGGLFAQLSFARAMKLADASLLVTVDFIRLPLALVIGLLFFGEPIRLDVVIGGAIILGAITLLFHREGRGTK